MPYFGEITNQVFRVLTTDNTLQFVYNHPLKEECKVYSNDGNYDVIPNCLDRIHYDYLINRLQGKITLTESQSITPDHETDFAFHYYINLFLYICLFILFVSICKPERKRSDLNPFRDTKIKNISGYKTYFTIIEDGLVPPAVTTTMCSPGLAKRQIATCAHPPEISNTFKGPERLLGSGNFGSRVIEGLFEGKPCAIKIVEGTCSYVDQEINIMRSQIFTNKIHYHKFERVNTKNLIYMELAITDLKSYFKREDKNDSLSVMSNREICMQVIEGVRELHERKIAHGDLSPTNILVGLSNSKPVIRIADFSLSSKRDNVIEFAYFKERLDREFNEWYAPEIFKSETFAYEDYTKADIHMLGYLLVYIISEARFLNLEDFLRYAHGLKNQLYKHNEPISYDDVRVLRCIDLVVAMTSFDPQVRFSIQSVAMYPALWDEGKCRNFMVAVSEYLKISETLFKRASTIDRKKKSTNKVFKKKKRLQNQPKLDDIRDTDESDVEEPQAISLEGQTDDQVNSLALRGKLLEYKVGICRKMEWIDVLPVDLIERLQTQFVNYDVKCPISLIRLFRNLHNHFKTNKDKVRTILGQTEDDFERFFSGYYPLILPIVYKQVQDYKKTFDMEGRYYNLEEDVDLRQIGMIGFSVGMTNYDLASDEGSQMSEDDQLFDWL